MLRIKELRETRGMSQWDLARKLDVHPNSVSLWERGLAMPSKDHLKALTRVFECKTGDLFAA
jgi:ribosome-binding protein aMBF1 (putative translation factor)